MLVSAMMLRLLSRPLAGLMAGLLTLALLGAGVAGGLHHHRGAEDSGHSCVICTAGHTPAVVTVAAALTAAPLAPRASVVLPAVSAARPVFIASAASRAPPLV